MTGDQTLQVIAAVMMLTLVGSSLLSRRLALGQVARMIAGWLLIFAAVLVGYSYRFELNAVVQRVAGDLLGERGQTVGGTLRVPMAPDGHFWVRARINGHEQRFLIDSGATTTALSARTADAADLTVDRGGFPVLINTANGTVEAQRTRIERLTMGPIVAKDMAAVVSPAFGDMNVLGMNFLSSLESWRVEGRTLILVPHQPRV
ncbi:TIGR02281 family clan AA aspartic protease [Sphingomonas sp. MAH-20]|uniref:TIGR02281 family clan AA aspartic protease n=1 Tax=Sphingomonas horti TaxID=2682842 RepID=A0A6I4J1L5_9SPHN|nr:TIGR02281 family clan AA aspartic protease [Sphingomonas sp. CGMCC 1.13658]MBA2919356.1 TIGR02281 family clan AA aspartic protease [Sphingomonas sp. CGMCC 1.13658]MVO78237.1 TIGR02281 family clan AA aspartic protease [Sphingomonas horti]